MSAFLAFLSSWDHGAWSFLFYVGQAFYPAMPASPTDALLMIKKICDVFSAVTVIGLLYKIGWQKLFIPNFSEFKNGVLTFWEDDRKWTISLVLGLAAFATPWMAQIAGAILKFIFGTN